MLIVNLILLVVFCIDERCGVMKGPCRVFLTPVISITICLFSSAPPLIWVCIILRPIPFAFGVVVIVFLNDFILFVLVLV